MQKGLDVQLLHRYSHFYYHNGVINIAMADLGDVLNDQKYIDYTINTVDFIFENAGYFEEGAEKVNKWRAPFGQFFIREELDDCGAMGASIMDAYFHRKNQTYTPYLEKAAGFIMEEMSRLEDGRYSANDCRRGSLLCYARYAMIVTMLGRERDSTGRAGWQSCSSR